MALLLDIHLSPSGLIGHEDGLNLPLMLTALSFAYDQDLVFEIDNIKSTIERYIVVRMFYHNPHSKSFSLGQEYFKFRSEEIYRAWVAVGKDERLKRVLSPDDLIALYICMIQYKWWRDLIRDYEYNFNADLLGEYRKFEGNLKVKFDETFSVFFARTSFGMHPWMKETSESSSKDASESPIGGVLADPSRTGHSYSVFQRSVDFSDESGNTERVCRHICEETSGIPPADESTDLIELFR